MAPYADSAMFLFVFAIWVIMTLFFLRKLCQEVRADISVGTGWLVFDISLNRTRYRIRAIPWGGAIEIGEYPAWSVLISALLGTLVTAILIGGPMTYILISVPHSSPIGLIEPSSAWLSRVGVPIASPAVVIAVDGYPVRGRASLAALIQNSNATHKVVIASADGRSTALASNVTSSDLTSLGLGTRLSPYIEILSATEAAARAGLKRGDLIFSANGERVTSAASLVDIFKSGTESVKIEGINSQLHPYELTVRRNQRPWLHWDFGLRVLTPPPENALAMHPDSVRSVLRNEIGAFSKYWNHSRLGLESMVRPAISRGENIVLAAHTGYLVLFAAVFLTGFLLARFPFFNLLIPIALLVRPGYRWWTIPALALVLFVNRPNLRAWAPALWIVFLIWQLWSSAEAGTWTVVLQVAEAKNLPLEWGF